MSAGKFCSNLFNTEHTTCMDHPLRITCTTNERASYTHFQSDRKRNLIFSAFDDYARGAPDEGYLASLTFPHTAFAIDSIVVVETR